MPHQSTIGFDHGGTALEGTWVRPEGDGPAPAVIVFADALGLRPLVGERVRDLAALGYVAVGADMYGDGVQFERGLDAAGHYLFFEEHPDVLRSRVVAWFEHVAGRAEVDADRIAAIGYCFGGRCVLELARSGAEARAVVSFHGVLSTRRPAEPGTVKSTVAVYAGANDPYAPPDHVRAFDDEMRAAGADYHLTVFGDGYHAFTDPEPPTDVGPGLRYDPLLDRLSWAGATTLLDHALR
jgi:dienelactone hydrolase